MTVDLLVPDIVPKKKHHKGHFLLLYYIKTIYFQYSINKYLYILYR